MIHHLLIQVFSFNAILGEVWTVISEVVQCQQERNLKKSRSWNLAKVFNLERSELEQKYEINPFSNWNKASAPLRGQTRNND